MDDTSYSRAVLHYSRRRAASRIGTGLMTWLGALRRSRCPQPELMPVGMPQTGPRGSGGAVRRPQPADGLRHTPQLPRRRRLMLGHGGGGLDTRAFYRSDAAVEKAPNPAAT